jgi:hexosaminidase
MTKLGLVSTVAAALVLATLPALAPGPAPVTIPALQHWTADTGTYTFGAQTRIVTSDPALSATARVFATDLRALTGIAVSVVGGPGKAGDIELQRGAASGGTEGYVLTAGSTLSVTSSSDSGVFNGTRTILQLLHTSRTVPAGTASDWPTYPERGLMLDTGRKYFSLEFLRDRIRDMAYLKLNYLHLHLSDNFGFRLESQTHPEIVSADHYSRQEIRSLIAFAAQYHVQIVPELDFPGHMDTILASHPALKLVSKSDAVSDGFIDLSKPASYDLMRDLINEYLPLFPSRFWHIGADEYVTNYADYPQLEQYARTHYGSAATGKDSYYGFINWADRLVRAAGKTTRMWNDGLKPGGATLTVNSDIVVEHWSAGALPWLGSAYTPQQLVDSGHLVMNNAYTPLYYTLGIGGTLLTAPVASMYDLWEPNTFVDGSHLRDPHSSLGAKLDVWCDDPNAQTEDQIARGIFPRLRVLSQQTWGSPKPAPIYLPYAGIISSVGAAPE